MMSLQRCSRFWMNAKHRCSSAWTARPFAGHVALLLPHAQELGESAQQDTLHRDHRDCKEMSSREIDASGALKMMIALRLPNRPGALWNALEPFACEGINLTKIESRPVPVRPFEYAFILELQNDRAASDIAGAVDAVATRTTWLRVMGTFPSASG
jgi:hypothetical protein